MIHIDLYIQNCKNTNKFFKCKLYIPSINLLKQNTHPKLYIILNNIT